MLRETSLKLLYGALADFDGRKEPKAVAGVQLDPRVVPLDVAIEMSPGDLLPEEDTSGVAIEVEMAIPADCLPIGAAPAFAPHQTGVDISHSISTAAPIVDNISDRLKALFSPKEDVALAPPAPFPALRM